MNHLLVQPCVAAFSAALRALLDMELEPCEPDAAPTRQREVTGLLGFTGTLTGVLAVSFSEHAALKLAASLLPIEVDEIGEDVVDAVGDAVSQIAAAARAELAVDDLVLGPAAVITGPRHRVRYAMSTAHATSTFASPWGSVRLEVGLTAATQQVAR